MENKNMRKLNVTVQCMAVYNSSIMVPRELTFEEAIKYAKEHIDEINLGSGSTYSNVVYFPDEERAFEEFHHCGRNYLHRITYRKKSPYTTTEWWDEDLKCWRS